MKFLICILIFFFTIPAMSCPAQILSNFGTEGSGFPSASGGWSFDSGTKILSGDNNVSGLLQQIPGVNISPETDSISLTAELTSFTGGLSSFIITLEDLSGNTINASFQFTDFGGGMTTVVEPIIAFNPNFTGEDIWWRISADGIATSPPTFSITLSTLAAVPEPSNFSLLVVAGCAFFILRRGCMRTT